MFLYTVVILLAVFAAYISQKLKPYDHKGSQYNGEAGIFLFISFFALFLLSGFRFNVGTDYLPYIKWFEGINSGGKTYFEPGFTYLNKFIGFYTTKAQFVFIISSLITLLLIYAAIRKSSRYAALSVFLFCSMSFIFYSFNTTRQFIAIGISLFAWRYLVERDVLKYAASIALASMFHKTALLLIPVYFVINYRFKKTHYYIISAIAFASVRVQDLILKYVLDLYPVYANNDFILKRSAPSEIFILSTIFLGLLAIFLLKTNMISRDDPEIRISVNLIFFTGLAHTALLWVPSINRLSLYLDITYILIIPLLISKIKPKAWRLTAVAIIVLYTSLYTYVSIGLHNSNNALPYDSVLFHLPSSSNGGK